MLLHSSLVCACVCLCVCFTCNTRTFLWMGGHFGWSSELQKTKDLILGFKGQSQRLVWMIRVRVSGPVIHCAYKSPDKDKNTRTRVCVCLCLWVKGMYMCVYMCVFVYQIHTYRWTSAKTLSMKG